MKELKTDVEIRLGEEAFNAAREEPVSQANDLGGIASRMLCVQLTMNKAVDDELNRMALLAPNDGEQIFGVGPNDEYSPVTVVRAAAHQAAACVLIAASLVALMAQPDPGSAPATRRDVILSAMNYLLSMSADEFSEGLKSQLPAVLAQLVKTFATN